MTSPLAGPTILLSDSDSGFGAVLGDLLSRHGYGVVHAPAAEGLGRLVSSLRPEVCILEDRLLGEGGLPAQCRAGADRRSAVIILGSAGSDDQAIEALEGGADDYLLKPCSPREILARVRAIERRRRRPPPPALISRYRFAGWNLELAGPVLTRPNGEVIILSDGQFSLLKAFVENPQRLVTRDELIGLIKGEGADTFDRSVDSQVCRLRRRLDVEDSRALIRTIRSEGYMFAAPVLPAA